MMMQNQMTKTEIDAGSIIELDQLRAEIWKQALLATDERSLVQNLLDETGPVLNCENVSFMPYDEELEEIVVLQQWRSDGSDVGLGEIVPKWIFKRYIGRPYIQLLFDELPALIKPILKIFQKKYGTRSTLFIPYGEAQYPDGYISINHYLYPKKYSEKDIELFRELSQIIHLRSKQLKSQAALEKANQELLKLQEELHEQAIHDPMTGLHNRRFMQEQFSHELARAKRERYPFSVIMMDIDELKFLNDTYGHHVGDLTLKRLADCLKEFTRANDIACRYGGDEFHIVMSRAKEEDALMRVEEWQQYLVDNPIKIDDTSITVKFSAGIACFPTHGVTIDDLNKNADAALYQAKESGRNRICLAVSL